MEMLLIGVTLVSLALATSLAAISWKVMRDHRRFASARVDALVALATGDEPVESDDWPEPSLDLPLAEDAATPRFAAPPARGAGRRRWLALATVGGALAIGAGAVYAVHASGATLLSTVLRAASKTEAPAAAPPLELRALQYSIDDAGTFVVSGVVADPAGGRTVDGLAAVVYLFDEDGTCVANNRAPIDAATLRAGAQSPFEVRVHAPAPVHRYRVGFRRADGSTVGHVDRRQEIR
jgi:hypothetical protein